MLPAEGAVSDDSCLARVEDLLGTVEGARRKVAEWVLTEPWNASRLSIVELARETGTSENAVTRFTRALGYRGYREFCQALNLDLGRRIGVLHTQPVEVVPAGKDHTTQSVFTGVFDLEVGCIKDTVAALDWTQVERAVSLLAGAGRILLAGTGSAAPVCQMAQYRFSNLGIAASWTADPMVMLSELAMLGPGDVLLAVSHSGRSRSTVEMTDLARSRGVPTVSITVDGASPLVSASEVALVICGPRTSPATAQFGARVSELVLLEAMATAVADTRFDGDRSHVEELATLQGRYNNIEPDWRRQRRG